MSLTIEPKGYGPVQLLVTPSEFQEFSDLLDQGFQVPAGGRFLDDFPIWDSIYLNPNVMRFGIFSDGDLISAAAVRLVNVKLHSQSETGSQLQSRLQQTVRAAIVGGVVTHPSWQGKGLASRTVAEAVGFASKTGAAVCFLWGSEHDLYRRLGFELCGQQIQIPLSQILARSASGSDLQVYEGWNSEIFSLIQSRKYGLVLQNEDLSWLSAHKNVRWFWTQNPQGSVNAYAALGRGIDLHDLVHEWGGEHSGVISILKKINKISNDSKSLNPAKKQNNPGSENLVLSGSPLAGSGETHSSVKLLASPLHLKEFGCPVGSFLEEYLCLAKILNPSHLMAQIYSRASSEIILNAQKKWAECSEHELVQTVFGPSSSVDAQLPVPFWIWGLDAG